MHLAGGGITYYTVVRWWYGNARQGGIWQVASGIITKRWSDGGMEVLEKLHLAGGKWYYYYTVVRWWYDLWILMARILNSLRKNCRSLSTTSSNPKGLVLHWSERSVVFASTRSLLVGCESCCPRGSLAPRLGRPATVRTNYQQRGQVQSPLRYTDTTDSLAGGVALSGMRPVR